MNDRIIHVEPKAGDMVWVVAEDLGPEELYDLQDQLEEQLADGVGAMVSNFPVEIHHLTDDSMGSGALLIVAEDLEDPTELRDRIHDLGIGRCAVVNVPLALEGLSKEDLLKLRRAIDSLLD